MTLLPYYTRPADAFLVWTLPDDVIEQRETLIKQFHDIRLAGFGGVAPFVRCSRYTWNEDPARSALRHIGALCRRHGLQCWIGPDPRFVSRDLIRGGRGLEVLLFGDRARADTVPHLATSVQGAFSVRCDLSPRHVHTLQEVAIEYSPLGLARVYAVRMGAGQHLPERVLDITSRTRMFYNARDRYVEAFGRLPGTATGPWRVLAFFRAITNHVDYSDREQIRRYLSLLTRLKRDGCFADGIMWDEAGFTCTYGTLPYSPSIRSRYGRATGRAIERDLWKLALITSDESHIRTRNAYYRAIQESVNAANEASARHARRLWGHGVVSGIHDTWHFESADMCDMNHGSLDLWKALRTKTGGFVDLGSVDQLRDPDSPWYAHLAAMNVLCASLGKMSRGGYAFNNLWTVGDDGGKGWQARVLGHCVNTMAIFGLRWLAHAYGPVGTIGQEHTFLGSPRLPGYPDHTTWTRFPEWNRRLAEHLAAAEHRLPEANVLVVFPIETLYAWSGTPADAAAAEIFRFLLALLDHHYHVDVLSSSLLSAGTWSGDTYVLDPGRYRAVILPFPQVIHRDTAALLRRGRGRVLLMSGDTARLDTGARVAPAAGDHSPDITGALAWLASFPDLRPVEVPSGVWATTTRLGTGVMVSVCPSRVGTTYAGSVTMDTRTTLLSTTGGLTRLFFPQDGSPVVVSSRT